MIPPKTLAHYPWVVVRVACVLCPRRGRYRLARLAARYGPEFPLDRLLAALSGDCPWWKPAEDIRKYEPHCGARFIDLEHSPQSVDKGREAVHRQRPPEREDVPQPKRSRRVEAPRTEAGAAPMLSGWPMPTITVTCAKCERHHPFSKADVQATIGDVRLVDLVRHLTADCPRWNSQSLYDLCGARIDPPV